ncbi:elongation factor G [Candidatus Lucifugimonas marina]|uniref:Elongation factor G n=1 Tax=Candidatus Lucifugimonas marina TaxID=3038979 RepID=A0AAJ6CSB1_9CHLR|nr:elongation factor G [SAR202 cluster bacterium JH702]MDG0870237.1 elongation factor G [SAR202 cluster bacterium JH639]WFG36200.1 elongation factor G [SAR202 cluster bacterium JH545]WFG40146.1 elongation factor G [SAR202 cluster bacterium JH1073]
MADLNTSQIRNVALVGHNGAGKTSLVDALFFTAGGTNRQGKVDDKTSYSDYEPEEQRRGSSIQLAVLPSDWKNHRINLLDTPGYPDFRGDMLSAVRVADAVILVVSAASGVEVGAQQAWNYTQDLGIPTVIVVNKLDRENSSFEQTCTELAESWGRQCVPVQGVDGDAESFGAVTTGELAESVIEAIAEADDDLMMKYLDGETLTSDEINTGLKTGILSRHIVPIFAASAASNIGSSELLDAIIDLLPSPDDVEKPEVPEGAQANLIFKTSADPFVGKLSYFRVYGATVKSNAPLWNVNKGESERVGQVYQATGKETAGVDSVVRGDIGVISRLSHTQTFDTLGEKGSDVKLGGVDLPSPVFALAVSPRAQSDLDKMAESLTRMTEEDPTLELERNADTSETVLHGLGDIHVDLAIERIARKFDVHLDTKLPSIPYRETIGGQTSVSYKHRKQSGGRGQYGHVVLEISPGETGKGITFGSKVVGGNVPKDYIPAVEKGIRNAAVDGVVAGYPVVDVSVMLTDGSSHSVDSSGMAFEIAGSMGFRQAVRDARPTLLEPVLKLRILAPNASAGDVMGDLQTRRARIEGMEPRGNGLTEITAEAPASMMQRYAADLRSLTHAQGDFTAVMDHYEPVPPQDAQKVIASRQSGEEE